MIDIHTHILPFVDDGSDTIEHSIEMLNEEQNIGVTDVILTPHYRQGFMETPENIRDQFARLNTEKRRLGLNINLHLGAEIFFNKNTKALLKEKKVLSINNSKFVLVEFDPFDVIDISEAVYELKMAGYVPIVAHIERYEYVRLSDILEIKSAGGLIQVNASSFIKKEKACKRKLIKKLIKLDLVDFVASDCHYHRTNYLSRAKDYVGRKFGKEKVEELFNSNAKYLL